MTGTIVFSPANLTISGTQTQNLTLNLSGPAPVGGLVIAFPLSNPSVATVGPSVTFAANATSMSVPVKGVAVGSTVIHASALPNLADTTANVTVGADIILPVNLVVQPGQTVNFPVTLANLAPAGGVFIALTDSDTSVLTLTPANVFIEAGQTQPPSPPQVTGVKLGSVTIAATASGFMSTSQTVQVGQSIPASVTAVSGGGQSAAISTAFASPLVVTVKDAGSNPVSGVTVTFTGPGSGAGIATTTAVTNASGVASATVTANATVGGPYTVTATAGSTSTTFSLTNTPGPAASVTAVSGGGQSAVFSTAFANPLVVTVKDAGNNL